MASHARPLIRKKRKPNQPTFLIQGWIVNFVFVEGLDSICKIAIF